MSDTDLTVGAARIIQKKPHLMSPEDALPAINTIVAQDERMGRLQSVIRNIDIARGDGWIDALTHNGVLLPGDMEATDE